MLTCSFFKCVRDNQPVRWDGEWPELVGVLERTYHPRSGLTGDEAKKSLPAISGAAFQPGTTRAGRNVNALGLLCLDFDNAVAVPSPGGERHRSGAPVTVKIQAERGATIAEVASHLEAQGQAAFLWSTWSDTPGWPRLRVVVPLASSCAPEQWEPFTEWALDHLGFNKWRPGLDMPALRDTARLNFLPGAPDASAIQRREVKGVPLIAPAGGLDVVKVPPIPIPEWQSMQIARRKREGRHWARRFRGSDGTALDLTTLDAVRLLRYLGCDVGVSRAAVGGVKYRTTCPWWQEHTHAENDDSAVLFIEPGRWPTWHCSHSHHVHLELKDLLLIGGMLHAS